ncbi:GNAT family N-acetyltransferase [Bailinhaonella thermotolerans]|uniref:N-acetyltransferase n=1 Tax=Bailinhaonella thermotolerans TaxID=1070861 RepID=A0A3A4AQ10_9ACTN|nr:GNAT family N-acetyltransferase [Bailinhaonella thermotolerans]RJL31776.1 N-acetyltransferase [Bailinhaonella thermotolerans]
MDGYLETERMTMRALTEDDADALIELDSDPEVMRFLTGGRPTPPEMIRNDHLPRLLARAARFPGYGYFAATEKATGRFLGWFELCPKDDPEVPELGYRLRRAAWGAGYATEGSRALVRKAFTELGARRVVAETMTVNKGSRRVMEKAGLTYVRTYFGDWPEAIEGSEHGEVVYALDRADWEAG